MKTVWGTFILLALGVLLALGAFMEAARPPQILALLPDSSVEELWSYRSMHGLAIFDPPFIEAGRGAGGDWTFIEVRVIGRFGSWEYHREEVAGRKTEETTFPYKIHAGTRWLMAIAFGLGILMGILRILGPRRWF
jgi:hypothetical protein